MNGHARHRIGAKSKQTRSANLKRSIFGSHARIQQGDRNIYIKCLRHLVSSPSREPSSAMRAQLKEKEKDDCRRSLRFRDIDARVQNISPTQPGTCEWFFQTSQFRQWYTRSEQDDRLLWIKGKPGTGKSTMMKRILEHCQAEQEYVIAAFFFNARGTELEKTPLGMLRSLLFQLLEHESSLYNELLPMFRKKLEEYSSEDWEWREPELKSFFLSEIPKCQPRPLLLIIDALDECSDRDVQDVSEFLQHLSKNAVDSNITLNICLSSRHYPQISLERCQELILEDREEHDEDIDTYIHYNLKQKDEAIEEEIEEAIKEKASGIFMWVVLVITILNRASREGRNETMKQKLDEIPTDLEKVFETLLNNNNPNQDETILILQCVLFAKRLLTPEEIYFALIAGTNSNRLGMWDSSQITPEIIRRRIVSSSRGLIEIRQGKNETVQFIHESVNDFLVRKGRLQMLDSKLKPDAIASSHDRLKDCCMSYIMMASLQLPKNWHHARDIESSYPFLRYASSYLLDHAEDATPEGQSKLLQELKDGSVFKRVERLHNFFWDYREYGRHLNLLHILAARGLQKLVVILLEGGADINAHGRPHGTALEAAINGQHEKTVEILLKKGAKIDARGKLTHSSALQKAVNTNNKEILAMLIDKGAKISFWEKLCNSSVLHAVIANGNKDAVAMLLGKGTNVNVRGPMGTALQTAAFFGEREIIEMLIEKGAKINAWGGFQGTALQAAAGNGEEEIVKMLLDKGAKVNARGLFGNALQRAAFNKEKDIVELLIKKGAKVNARGLIGTALQAAAFRGEKEIVEMLLDKGAKVNARGLIGTALQAAAVKGEKEIMEVLLDKGAKVNARGPIYTALQAAAIEGQKEIVEMLLDKGAKVNARGLYFTALQAAAAGGEIEIVEMLLDKGAKINIWGGFCSSVLKGVAAFRGEVDIVEMLMEKGAKINAWEGLLSTALQTAVSDGEAGVVEMLLEKGAKINAWGGLQSTALQAAALHGEKEIAEMLIKKGANVNAWGGLQGTALQAAASNGHEHVVKMLLEKGAKINAWGGLRGNALQAAASNGHEDIVKMLLEKGARINAWGGHRGNALQAAVSGEEEDIVEMLLENGAKETNWKGIYSIYQFVRGINAYGDTSEDEDDSEHDSEDDYISEEEEEEEEEEDNVGTA